MKKMNKLMAIGLSLVMCAGMTVPAFAADGYYALEVIPGNLTEDDILEIVEDGCTGFSPNTGWTFVGTGEVPDNFTGSQNFTNGELPEGFEAPDANGATTLEGGHFHNGYKNVGQDVTAEIENFHDIAGYTYDDGTGDTVAEKTYTVTWTEAKDPTQAGISVDLSECANKDDIVNANLKL